MTKDNTMTPEKHTPWRIAEYDGSAARAADIVMIKSADGDYVAECVPRNVAPLLANSWTIPALRAALEGVLPYMEAAEDAGLVGDEGCHWPVEEVRAALALGQEETET